MDYQDHLLQCKIALDSITNANSLEKLTIEPRYNREAMQLEWKVTVISIIDTKEHTFYDTDLTQAIVNAIYFITPPSNE